jgi:O-acetyl-ADP-ribose deacetylase (regulator of RNase III)
MDNHSNTVETEPLNTDNIHYVTGDLFESHAECLVNAVNTVGVMGAGIAADFKRRYPSMFESYKTQCENGQLKIGTLMFYKPKNDTDKVVCLFPTKEHWANPSRTEYIEAGLRAFVRFHKEWNIRSIAFPKLGCGLGGLDWEYEVKPLMEKYLTGLDVEIQIYV